MSALFGGRQFASHDTDIPVVTALLNLSEFAIPALHVYDTLGRGIEIGLKHIRSPLLFLLWAMRARSFVVVLALAAEERTNSSERM